MKTDLIFRDVDVAFAGHIMTIASIIGDLESTSDLCQTQDYLMVILFVIDQLIDITYLNETDKEAADRVGQLLVPMRDAIVQFVKK